MSTSTLSRTALPRHSALVGSRRVTGATFNPLVWRTLLLAGCVAAVGVAGWIGDPGPFRHADPELARLLRGMALIKACMVLAAAAAVFWRFGWPAPQRAAATCVISVWLLAGSTALIWQLTSLVPAAIGFHAAGLALLVLAWRDHQAETASHRAVPN